MNEDQFKVLSEQLKNLEEKSDQLIILQAISAVAEMETMNEKKLFLGGIGLNRTQIAIACNTTPGTVSVRFSEAKKKGKKK
ncbi:MAG: hypothetical protein IH995_03920 [Proteobacteria bacterium]|nr:hypothetical protein [Pseudomonadota bacterium]